MLVNTLEPVLFSLGPLAIHWYGVLYATGVFFAYWYARREIIQNRFKTTLEAFDSVFLWIVVGMLIGARLFEVFFYAPSYYFSQPFKILAIWQGGLSFHGGLIGAALAGYWWGKRKGIPFLHLADMLIIPAAMAQALGRLGNFFNQELPGKIWTGPWAVIFPRVDESPRHPVQIYEILYNLVIFGVLFALRKKNLPAGGLLSIFLVLYGAFRFITEFFKEPEVFFAGLALGQWLSIAMVAVGVWLWFKIRPKAV